MYSLSWGQESQPAQPPPSPSPDQSIIYEYVDGDSTSGFGLDDMTVDVVFGGDSECRSIYDYRLKYENIVGLTCHINDAAGGVEIRNNSSVDELYNHAESRVLSSITSRLRSANDCRLAYVDDYLGGPERPVAPAVRDSINSQVDEALTRNAEVLSKLAQEYDRLRKIGGRGSPAKQKKMQELKAGISMVLRQVPFGNQSAVNEKLVDAVIAGGDTAQLKQAFQAGMRQHQNELRTSSGRLNWALAPPGTTDEKKEEDWGKPGITNEFKKQLLAGNLDLVDEYLKAQGKEPSEYKALRCHLKANLIDGRSYETAAKVFTEVAGVVAVSFLFPPAAPGAVGVAGTAAVGGRALSLAARSRNLAGRVLGLGGPLTARGAASYLAALTPSLPFITERCFGPNAPAFAAYADLNPGASCDIGNSLKFTEAENRLAECATEAAFGGALAALGPFARYLVKSSRPVRELAEEALEDADNVITVTGAPRARDQLRTKSVRDLERMSLNDKKELDDILKKGIDQDVNQSVEELIKLGPTEFLRKYNGELSQAQKNRVRVLYSRLTRERQALTTRRTQEDLRLNLRREKLERVDCGKLNRINTDPAWDANSPCHRVTFERPSRNYCACGGERGIGSWLAPCPRRPGDYLTPTEHVDRSALPASSAVQFCRRVEIKPGTTCFHGGLAPAFAGFGGGAQLYCEGAFNIKGSERSQASARVRREKAIQEGLIPADRTDFQEFDVVAIAPITEDPALARIFTLGTSCAKRSGRSCDQSSMRTIREQWQAYLRQNPNVDAETRRTVEIHFEYLEGRRRITRQGVYTDPE